MKAPPHWQAFAALVARERSHHAESKASRVGPGVLEFLPRWLNLALDPRAQLLNSRGPLRCPHSQHHRWFRLQPPEKLVWFVRRVHLGSEQDIQVLHGKRQWPQPRVKTRFIRRACAGGGVRALTSRPKFQIARHFAVRTPSTLT